MDPADPATHAPIGVPQQDRGPPPGEAPVHGSGGSLLHKIVTLYASLMCSSLMAIGISLVLHSVQSASFLSQDVFGDDGLRGLKTAAIMLFGNFAIPFSETAASLALSSELFTPESLPQTLGMTVWNFWLPVILGITLILYGLAGHLSVKIKHAACILPFATLAVLFLVWQVELNQVIAKVAYAEQITLMPGQTHLQPMQAMHYDMYKFSYERFSELLQKMSCAVSLHKGMSDFKPIRMVCQDSSMEAKMMELAVTEFCNSGTPDENVTKQFDIRVKVCKSQGRQLNILPVKLMPREDAYCRCRLSVYNCLQIMSRWSMVVWFGELTGVCAVLYLGMEPNLAKMAASQRRDVLVFAVLGIAILAARVTLFEGTLSEGMSRIEREAEDGAAN